MSYPSIDDLDRAQALLDQYPYIPHPQAWERIDKLGAGDCKDFVLGKLHFLLDAGWPIAALRVAACYVEPEARVVDPVRRSVGTHAVLVVATDEGDRVLDQRQACVVRLEELQRAGYEPIEIQEAGGSPRYVAWGWA